jgi:hypothetical protein
VGRCAPPLVQTFSKCALRSASESPGIVYFSRARVAHRRQARVPQGASTTPVGRHKRASERGRPIERRRRHLEGRDVCANGCHEVREHVWTNYDLRCDNEKEKAGLRVGVRGSKAQCGAGAPLSLSSPMARHAQEERPLRSCHDSSNSTGGMCGSGLLAQGQVYGRRETEDGMLWMWVQREMGEKKSCLAPIF